MDPLEPVLSKVLIAFVLVSALSNILCCQKRWLAEHFFNLECLTRIIAIMIPNHAGYSFRDNQMHLFVLGVAFTTLFCGAGKDIIIGTLTLLFHEIVGMRVNYGDGKFDMGDVFSILVVTTSFFIGVNSAGMLLIYIKETNMKLHNTNESNISTLNGMHEGVLILKNHSLNSRARIAYCNKQASELIHRIDK